jgi:hypothetical protein
VTKTKYQVRQLFHRETIEPVGVPGIICDNRYIFFTIAGLGQCRKTNNVQRYTYCRKEFVHISY